MLHSRLTHLDGFRGIAVIMVMLYHFAHIKTTSTGAFDDVIQYILMSGWIGVDFFFVLSGFLITRILVNTRNDEHRWLNFVARRSLRIFPAYFAYVLGLMLLVYSNYELFIGSRDVEYTENWGMAFLFASNIDILINGVNIGPATGHLWSLAVEEQFYLIWPWFIFLLSTNVIRKICVALLVGALAVRLGMWQAGFDQWQITTFTLSRVDALAAGALIATASQHSILHNKKIIAWGLILLGLILVLTFVFFGPKPRNSILMQTLGLSFIALFAGCLLTATINGVWGLQKVFSNSVLQFFGRYSYMLYLIHPLMRALFLGALPNRFEEWSFLPLFILTTIVAGGASIFIALVSDRILEKPFLRLKRHFEPRSQREVVT